MTEDAPASKKGRGRSFQNEVELAFDEVIRYLQDNDDNLVTLTQLADQMQEVLTAAESDASAFNV